MTPLVDIGANLANKAFRSDVDAVIERAVGAGVGRIVVTGTNVAVTRSALELAHRHPGRLWVTAGIHPHHASTVDHELDAIRTLSRQSAIVAIGECGLDFNRNFSSEHDQLRCFDAHIELAIECSLPLFLHERDAHEKFVDRLARHADRRPPAVVHCFTGTRDQLERYVALDLYIGITGWICDERRGAHLRQLVERIPRERLLIETDAPYLLPRDLPGRPKSGRNEPAFLSHVLATVAACRGEAPEAVAEATTINAERFFAFRG